MHDVILVIICMADCVHMFWNGIAIVLNSDRSNSTNSFNDEIGLQIVLWPFHSTRDAGIRPHMRVSLHFKAHYACACCIESAIWRVHGYIVCF